MRTRNLFFVVMVVLLLVSACAQPTAAPAPAAVAPQREGEGENGDSWLQKYRFARRNANRESALSAERR